jgi:cytochrome oxidase Cu insertion factor (SCO1/SenC/PrrC family)
VIAHRQRVCRKCGGGFAANEGNYMIINNFIKRIAVVACLLSACVWTTGAHAAEGLFPSATVMAAPKQPTKLPEFEFANLHGGTLKSSEMKGKVIIIRFWATW